MTNVFISYSKRRDLTFRLRDYLKSKGLTVWVDQDALEARGEFDGQIRAGLQQAETIITLWTEEAIASKWVIAEATYAADGPDGPKLINVVPHPVSRGQLPERFQKYHLLVETDLRPLDMERIFDQVIKIRDGVPLPAEVPLREHYEAKYDELLLDTKRLPLPNDAAEAPSILLQAKYNVVPFIDLQGLQPALINWALGEGEGARFKPAAGRLIHGPGGLGKTRLMIEVASALREKGWSAGFLNRLDLRADDPEPELRQKPKLREEAFQQLITNGEDAGVAIVIDYAEGRTEEVKALAARIRKAARERPDRPLILFLLVREIGEWWDDLRKDPSVDATFAAGLGQLSEVAIADDLATLKRCVLFDAAREKFADALAKSPGIKANRDTPSAAVLARLDTNPDYDRPLAVLMEALLHVYAEINTGNDSGIAGLLDRILDLEVLHWQKVVEADEAQLRARGEPPGRPRFLDHRRALADGTCLATLVGGTSSRDETRKLLAAANRHSVGTDLLRDLQTFYGNGRKGLSGLEPDLLGERLVINEADFDDEKAYRLVLACLEHDAAGPVRWRQILTVLNRATKPDHGAKAVLLQTLLTRLIRDHAVDLAPAIVAVALAEPDGRLPHVITNALPTLDEAQLDAFERAMPQSTVALREAALALAEKQLELAQTAVVTSAPADEETQIAAAATLAARVTMLGNCLSNVGRRDDALKASQEAVEIYRRLAAERPNAYLPALAMCLNNLSMMHSNLGNRERALKASLEAAEIYRRFASDQPEAFLPDLAGSLNNLSRDLLNLGHREKALKASQEAVEIYRRLVADRPNAFLPDLAMSLNNVSIGLSKLGHREDALKASQEAVDVRRRLAASRPDAFLPDLAASLTNFGSDLSNVGRPKDALKASQEAVEIYRRLAADRQDAFLPNLATSLNNIGVDLSDLGHREDALAASQESVDIRRRLAADRPDAFLPDLAGSLNNLAQSNSKLGRREDALRASQEAVEIYRRLVADRPNAFLPDLAMSLNTLGIELSKLGHSEDALAASQEAVEIRRRLAADRPDAFLPNLARSLGALSRSYMGLGRRADAALAAKEALVTILPLAEANTRAFGYLARTLARDYALAAHASSVALDTDLLQRVAKVVGAVRTIDEQQPNVKPAAIPEMLVEQFFGADEAQEMLRQIMAANGLDGAPAELPTETKKAIFAMLVQNGVIQLGRSPTTTGDS